MSNPVIEELINIQKAGLLDPVDCINFDNLVTCRKRGWIIADSKGCYSLTFAGTQLLSEQVQDKPQQKIAAPASVSNLARSMLTELESLNQLKYMQSHECNSLAAMHACEGRGWVDRDAKGRFVLTKVGRQVLKDSKGAVKP